MTSSLVGSEMCIRDRSSPGSGRDRWRIATTRRRSRSTSSETTRRGGHRAVSYTHLTLPTICSV
eukprot:9580368-Prorocentrum_lima.AAC.1